jgi:hypothetical protein
MHIDLDDAIKIYAKALRARHGRKARKRIIESIQALRAQGDLAGVVVWQRVAIELERLDAQRAMHPPAAWHPEAAGDRGRETTAPLAPPGQ